MYLGDGIKFFLNSGGIFLCMITYYFLNRPKQGPRILEDLGTLKDSIFTETMRTIQGTYYVQNTITPLSPTQFLSGWSSNFPTPKLNPVGGPSDF